MSLLKRATSAPAAAATATPGRAPVSRLEVRTAGNPVAPSAELYRIAALPRRDLATAYTPADVAALEDRLRRKDGRPCVCAKMGRRCPTNLLPVQAQALLEAERAGGLVAPIGVGHGKTLVDLLLASVMGAKKAVLLVPAQLRPQLLERDWPYYGGHWNLPNIVLSSASEFRPGASSLHVITYNKLSTA